MSEQIGGKLEIAHSVRMGTIENLQMIACEEKPSGGVLSRDNLFEYLDGSGVVRAMATAVFVNILEDDAPSCYPESSIENPRRGYITQSFNCGVGLDTGSTVVYFEGARNNCLDPDRQGLFDYRYRLSLPIKSYTAGGLHFNPEGVVDASYSSWFSHLSYDSSEGSHCIGTEDLTSVLHEAIGDLIASIDQKEFSEEQIKDLSHRALAFMESDQR